MTFKIALYGAVLSTISILASLVSLIISFFNYRRDRANIKIIITDKKEELPVGTSAYDDTMKPFICVDIVNKGRRPIIIKECFLRLPNNKINLDLSVGRGAVTLPEGDFTTYLMPEEEIKRYNFTKKDLVLTVIDAEGKNHWSNCFLMRWIKLRICNHKMKKAENKNKEKEGFFNKG